MEAFGKLETGFSMILDRNIQVYKEQAGKCFLL